MFKYFGRLTTARTVPAVVNKQEKFRPLAIYFRANGFRGDKTISGTTRVGNPPEAQACLSRLYGNDGTYLGVFPADNNGQFLIKGLASGRYRLVVERYDQSHFPRLFVVDVT